MLTHHKTMLRDISAIAIASIGMIGFEDKDIPTFVSMDAVSPVSIRDSFWHVSPPIVSDRGIIA